MHDNNLEGDNLCDIQEDVQDDSQDNVQDDSPMLDILHVPFVGIDTQGLNITISEHWDRQMQSFISLSCNIGNVQDLKAELETFIRLSNEKLEMNINEFHEFLSKKGLESAEDEKLLGCWFNKENERVRLESYLQAIHDVFSKYLE